MNEYVLTYIKKRMEEMGYPTFHLQPVFVTDAGNSKTIRAYNQFYFLVAKVVPADLVIKADNNYFDEGATYNDVAYYNIQEFTGEINITQGAAGIKLEFLRAIPE